MEDRICSNESALNEKNNTMLIWSDDWYIENDKVWFVSGGQNILFCLDLNKKKCEYAIGIPDDNPQKFRCNPRCIKYGSEIYCMPDMGSSIWVYNAESGIFFEICFDNPSKARMSVGLSIIYGSKLYAVSYGLGNINEIDLKNKKVTGCYKLGAEEVILDCVKAETKLYSLLESGRICCFHMETKEIVTGKISDIEKRFCRLCFDGKKFWLSGYCKKVYVWNEEEGTITTIEIFQKEFGIYNYEGDTDGELDCLTKEYNNPAFENIVVGGDYIWFIPFRTNKIVYVNKDTYELCFFEIEEENETKQSLLRNELKQKYILEYVKDDRYIGLYSTKNHSILEIDAKMLKYRWYGYDFNDEGLIKKCAEILGNTFREKDEFERNVYRRRLMAEKHDLFSMDKNNVGIKVYQAVMHK